MKAYVYLTFPSHYVILSSSVQVTACIHLCATYVTNLIATVVQTIFFNKANSVLITIAVHS